MIEQGSVTVLIEDGIGVIEFSHPAANSCTSQMLAQMTAGVETLSENSSVKGILIRSTTETTFCAGANLSEVVSIDQLDQASSFFMGFANLILALKNSPKFTIARVQGNTVGGGVGIVSACDLVLASTNAKVRLSEINLGIAPLVIAPAIIHKIGVTGFATVALNPDQWNDVNWAYQKGLFSHQYDSIERLDEELNLKLDAIRHWSEAAIDKLKATFWEGTAHWDTLLKENAKKTAELALTSYTQEKLNKYRK